MNPKASLLALLALASSTVYANVNAADAHAGPAAVQARHHNVARNINHGMKAHPVALNNVGRKARRSTGNKAARCAAKTSSLSSASALSTQSIASVSSTSSQDTPTTTSTSNAWTPPATTWTPPITTTHHTKTHTPTPSSDSGSGGSGSSGGGGTYTGDATFYTPGLNGCGTTDGPNSMIAAASHALFQSYPGYTGDSNTNPICGKWVTAHWQGRSTTVQITDLCMGCEVYGSLDFSPDAFMQLTGDMGLGRVHGMTWSFD